MNSAALVMIQFKYNIIFKKSTATATVDVHFLLSLIFYKYLFSHKWVGWEIKEKNQQSNRELVQI